jgi:hypothetical protein
MSQPSAQGIASLFRGNPAPLQQRIQQEQQGKPGLPPDLHELMALNIVTNETDAMAKQKAMDQLAQMQGPQGKPPTVMDSVREQARQKMQAQQVQAQQQQQAMQAMMQQAGPGPVPPGTPQPESQPEAQGIDDLPVEFGLAGGGIVAFQNRGSVPRIQDEPTISDEERARLERELLMRIIGEETRNPPSRSAPMEITESDIASIPGMEPSDLRARALREATGPETDNRAMINAAEARAERKNAMMDREREKAANRPKYETSYDRMNRKNRGEMTEEERQAQAAREARISQIPTGGEPTVTGGERVRGSETERNILNTLAALPGASVTKATTLGRQSLAGLASLLGMDKSNAPERQAAPQAAPQAAAPQAAAPYSNEGRTGPRPYTPAPRPIADLRALADQQVRQQEPRPAPATSTAEQQQPPAAPVAPSANIAPPQSEADRILNERLMQDPTVAAANKEMMYQSRIGAPDTTQRDAMIKQLQEERARQVGPQDSFGQLMEYLGQIAATPRGLSSFEAGAAGARGVRVLEEQRAQKRFDLGSKIIEQEQGKIDASRAYAKEVYGVGEREYDQIFKAQYEAAKQISSNEMEARKLAQENTLKRLEIERRENEARERNRTQLQGYYMQQLGERNEQARIDKITSLKQQARRATDPKIAKELMDQAEDLEKAIGRGAGASGAAGAERNDIAAIKNIQAGLLKELSENLRMDAATRAKKQAQLDQTYVDLARLGGASPATSTQTGKVVDFNSLPK